MKCWVILRKEGNIWVSHILELDLVTQGFQIGEALDMTKDVISSYPRPSCLRKAPEEFFSELREILLMGEPILSESLTDDLDPESRIALQMTTEGESLGVCWVWT